MRKLFSALMLAAMLSVSANAQDPTLTKEQVLAMSIDELSDLSLEDLMYAVELLDLKSVDELFALIMNKNVSSASKKAEDSFKSPLSTSVISKEEMRTYGCTTMEEALRLVTGMIVREKTNGNYDIHIRGLENIPDGNMLLYSENVNTLLMINGRPTFNYGTGSTMWETLPVSIEDIARIEVVRGPSSALYGSNAVTGVINIITEVPNADSRLVSGSIQSGSQGTYVGDVAIRKTFGDKLAASLSGNYQMRNRTTRDIYLMPNAALFDPNDATRDFSQGQWVSLTDAEGIRVHTANNGISELSEKSAPTDECFPRPELARSNVGVNGALTYTPAADIDVNLTAGYQQSYSTTTTIGTDYFALNQHESKQYYFDVTSNIKNLFVQFNYTDGPQNFMVGTPGFKVRSQQINSNVDYDWEVNKQLTLRPGLNYRMNKMDDYDYRWNYGVNRFGEEIKLPSFFDGSAMLTAMAASIRADYQPIDQLRLIAAYRAERLNMPKKVYSSWQLAATYSPSDNNNLRFIYSRANRSSNFTNTSASYTQNRVNYGFPDEVSFWGNKDAKVMIADNLELGYRTRPFSNVMIDAEAYYSMSKDYGALMSYNSNMLQTTGNIQKLMQSIGGVLMQYGSGVIDATQMQNEISRLGQLDVISKAYIKYQNLPYKVHQMGLGISMDWVISDKLVAKMHANVQSTKIDNYYEYDKTADMGLQFQKAGKLYAGALQEIVGMVADPNKQEWLSSVFSYQNYQQYAPEYEALLDAEGNSTAASEQFLQQFYNKEMIASYFGLKYGCDITEDLSRVTIGTSSAHAQQTEQNGYKHKATPTYYGMIGLIYKPISKLSVAAHGYFYGKQTMKTEYGVADVAAKMIMNLKVGYRPTEQFEVFFNAHNLFNDSKREFAFTDHTRGIYSLGINFNY